MGNTSAYEKLYGPVPGFAALFTSPKYREDAEEAVKLLPARVNRWNARAIIWKAQMEDRFLRKYLPTAARKDQEFQQAVDLVARRMTDPATGHRPPWQIEWLAAHPAPPKKRRRGGQVREHYRMALKDLMSIKVPRRLALAMLRGAGFSVSGPRP